MIDIAKASEFMRANARLLDRRRFELLFANASAETALSSYANPDGRFGYGLEPDLRSVSSQPGGTLHAFEVLEDIAPETSPVGVQLCDWLDAEGSVWDEVLAEEPRPHLALEGEAIDRALAATGNFADLISPFFT